MFTALLGLIALQQRRLAVTSAKNEHLESLQRQAEASLTALRNDQIPAGIGLLNAFVKDDPYMDQPSYHLLHRYLRPLLTTRDEVLSPMPAPSVFRWQGADYALRADRHIMLLSSNGAIQSYAVVSHGRYLMTADVNRFLCTFDLRLQTRVQCASLANSVPQKLYEQPFGGSIAVLALSMGTTEDEDSPDSQDVGTPQLFVLRTPSSSPEKKLHSIAPTRACAKDDQGPCGFVQVA